MSGSRFAKKKLIKTGLLAKVLPKAASHLISHFRREKKTFMVASVKRTFRGAVNIFEIVKKLKAKKFDSLFRIKIFDCTLPDSADVNASISLHNK